MILAAFAVFLHNSEAKWGITSSPADIVESALPSVVNISALTLVSEYSYYGPGIDDFFRQFGMVTPRSRPRTSLGSGFIIDEDGEILTNDHVVSEADEVNIILSDGSKYKAKILGRDSKLDIALLKIDAKKKFTPIAFGNSDKIRIAEDVYAIGNPFGLSHSVSKGIISAKHRSLGSGPFDDYLQTDAAINFGNSGGPLIDENGKVVGISTAVKANSQGLGFAIPINLVKPLLTELRTHGKILRGWLGIVGKDLSPVFAKQVTDGVGVSRVVIDAPAHKNGIEVGDVIVEINGEKVSSTDELQIYLSRFKIRDKIKVVIFRNGKRINKGVVLDAYPAENLLPSGYDFM